MTFNDPWLSDDTECLTQTCLVERPSAVIQTLASSWGLGDASTSAAPEYVPLVCMEIPMRLFIDRTEGVTRSVSLGLILDDVDDIVEQQTRITFLNTRYQVTELLEPSQHGLKRVLLKEIGASGN